MLLVLLSGSRPAAAQQLSFQLFGEDSGLSNVDIESLAQDNAGFLYVGTENGLYRYDGFRFERFGAREGLPETSQVEAVRAASDGRIWVVSLDRVYLLGNGLSASAPLEPLADDHYANRADVLGNDLLLVRNGRLLRISPGPQGSLSVRPMLRAMPAGDTRRALLADLDTLHVDHGQVWLGCGTAICRLDGAGVRVLDAGSGLPPDRWTGLLRDHQGTLWVRSAARIASLPRGAARFTVTDVPGGPGRFAHEAGTLALVEDAAGRVVTQGARGLVVREHGKWILFDHGEGLSYVVVSTMLVDREGSLWTGSQGRGVARMIGLGMFETWTRAQGLSDDLIWSVKRDGGGTLWVANDLALDALADRDAAPRGHYPLLAYAMAVSPRGRLWIGEQGGSLIRRDPRTGRSETVAHVAPIRVMATDPAGQLWIGTNTGLLRIDDPDAPATPVEADLKSFTGRVFDIKFDAAGELWVLGDKTLFHRDAGKRWHAVLQTDPEGGYQTRVMVFAPDGTLWLGSYTNGITRLHLEHGGVVASDSEPNAHLASTEVEVMLRDTAGRIWIGTDHGLDVSKDGRWRHLDEQDGLASNDVDGGAAYTDDDGTSWFGTTAGLSHLIGADGLFGSGHPGLHPVITRLSIGDRELPLAQVRQGLTHLRWSADPLVIGFSSLDFKHAKSISFRYRLRGVDPGWVETTAHEVRYPSLPSGKLVFEVMAVDAMHRQESGPARMTIKIHPPPWRTWPAYAAEAILATVALVLASRWRVRYLLRRQHQLEALVRERTREIEQARLILFKQATFDALTGLLNRSAIMEHLRLAMQRAEASGAPLAVALLDLDYFKKINDMFGHLGGDAVLAELGRRLAAYTREGADAGRYGGEELLLVLPGLREGISGRVERLRHAVFAPPFPFEGESIGMTCSMGVTWLCPGDDVTSMIRRADAALYAAKRNGRNRIIFDPPLPASRTREAS